MSKKRVSGSVVSQPSSQPVPKYQPTPKELAAVAALRERRQQRPPAPKLTLERKGEAVTLGFDHPDPETAWAILVNALGAADYDFTNGLIRQLVNAGGGRDGCDPDGPNFLLGVIKGVAPKDEVECMLAAQMAVTHTLAMGFGRRLAIADTPQMHDTAERAFTKLTRTFTAQIEGLKRYRNNGEQKIQVSHVVVNDGGQAVVGNVSVGPGGGDGSKKAETTP